MGGTFNPIHYGHLRAAEEIAEAVGLDRVDFIPSARPPHKNPPQTPFGHRLAMTRLAVDDRPGFFASDIEGQRQGPSFTIDTLKRMSADFGQETRLYFITGLDAFFDLHTWKSHRQLFQWARFVVITRPGFSEGDMGDYLAQRVSPDYRWQPERSRFTHPDLSPVLFQSVTWLDISSTDLRRRMAYGRSIRYLTPEAVRRYIFDNALYRHLEKGKE